MSKPHVRRLRLIALIEGISFVVLLFIAMPLKYGFGHAAAVKWAGMAHGGLFILFCLALLIAMIKARWSVIYSGLIFATSFIPFGWMLIDKRLKAHEAESVV